MIAATLQPPAQQAADAQVANSASAAPLKIGKVTLKEPAAQASQDSIHSGATQTGADFVVDSGRRTQQAQKAARDLGIDIDKSSAYFKNPESIDMAQTKASNPTAFQQYANSTGKGELINMRAANGQSLAKAATNDGIDMAAQDLNKSTIGEDLSKTLQEIDDSFAKKTSEIYKEAEKKGLNLSLDDPKNYAKNLIENVVQNSGATSGLTREEFKPIAKKWKEIFRGAEKEGRDVTVNDAEGLRKAAQYLNFKNATPAQAQRIRSLFSDAHYDDLGKRGLYDVFPEARAAHTQRKELQKAFSYLIDESGNPTSKNAFKALDQILSPYSDAGVNIINGLKETIAKSTNEETASKARLVLQNLQQYVAQTVKSSLDDPKSNALSKITGLVEDGTRTLTPVYKALFSDGKNNLTALGKALENTGILGRHYYGLKDLQGSSSVNADIANKSGILSSVAQGLYKLATGNPVGGAKDVASEALKYAKTADHAKAVKFFKTGTMRPESETIAGQLKKNAATQSGQLLTRPINANPPTQE